MKIKSILLPMLGLLLIIAVSGWAADSSRYQDPAVEYSADQVITADNVQVMSKVFHAHKKLRMEANDVITITRMDKNVVWLLMPQMSSYQEHSTDDPSSSKDRVDLNNGTVEVTAMGTETVNGIKTTKNKVVVTDPQGNKTPGYMWISKEGIMVKGTFTDTSQGSAKTSTIELKNLKIGQQDPKLFEIPSGYSKMAAFGMPGGSLSDMLKGSSAPGQTAIPEGRKPEASGQQVQTSKDVSGGGRAYTSTGRSYTSQPRGDSASENPIVKGTKAGADALNKLRGIFGK